MLGIGIICISALAGGWLVLNQQTSLWGIRLANHPPDFGQIMLFFAFLIGCTDPLRKMADVYGSLQGGAAAADRRGEGGGSAVQEREQDHQAQHAAVDPRVPQVAQGVHDRLALVLDDQQVDMPRLPAALSLPFAGLALLQLLF